ncbi:MAG: hypothetical protein VX642_00290 [Bdellovibrionota bacterium]|nr:hypothetical protein [Bdellovibrionota bacterium]
MITLLIFVLACSPQASDRDFGDRTEFEEFGPVMSDVADRDYALDVSELMNFREVIGSEQIFYTSLDILESLQFKRNSLEERSHRLAYKIRKEIYGLGVLEAKLANPPQSLSTKSLDYLNELLLAVELQDAIGLQNYRDRVNGVYGKFGEITPFSQTVSKLELEWLSFAKKLSSTRFLYGDVNSKKQDLLNLLPKRNSNKVVTFGFEKELLSFLKSKFEVLSASEEQLSFQAQSLIDRFYLEEANSLKFEVENSAYLETALGLYGGDVYQLWSKSFQDIKKQVRKAFRNISIQIPRPSNQEEWLRPALVIQKLESELDLLVDALRREGVDEKAVTAVQKQIDGLGPLIQFAKSNMDQMRTTNLPKNVELFNQVLDRLEDAKLFPESIISMVRTEVEFPEDIRRQIELIEKSSSSEDLRLALSQTIIIKIWRYKRAQVQKEFDALYEKVKAAGCVMPSSMILPNSNPLQNFAYNLYMTHGEKAGSCDEYPDLEWAYQRFFFKVDELAKVFGGKALVYALFMMSEDDLDWLAKVDADHPEVQSNWWRYITSPIKKTTSALIRDHVSDTGIGLFIDQIDQSVNEAFLKKVSLRLADELSRFDKIIENTIMKTLKDSRYEPRDFYYQLKSVAKKEIGSKILNDSPVKTFNLYEAAKVKAVFGLDAWEFRRHNPSSAYFLTGSEAINSSLSARILGFWASTNLDEPLQESLAKFGGDSKKAFELVNKAVSLMGTRDYFGRLTGSLITNLSSLTPKRLDIYTYGYEDQVFSAPDQIWLDPNTSYFELGLVPEHRNFSVSNQASLLQSGRYLMEILADYEESPLDFKLHNLDYEGVAFFPKESLLELGLGLASVVLRNLHKDGLLLFDIDRNKLEITEENKSTIASKVTSAALVSFVDGKRDSVVNAAEMARYMLALSEFIQTSERIGLARSNTMIYLNPETGEGTLMELRKATDLLRKLYIGMANFISSRMRDSDYLYFDHYKLKAGKAFGKKSLETQLLVDRALLKANEMWGAEVFVWSALDNYYQLNHKFLDTKFGYYRFGKKWPPYLLALSYRYLNELSHSKTALSFMTKEAKSHLETLKLHHEEMLKEILK